MAAERVRITRAEEVLRARSGPGTESGEHVVARNVGTRCADRLVSVLERAGVNIVYGVPGGAISPIYDALIDHSRMHVVHTRHETTALFMAIGHTRMRPDALPAVLVTSGPGVTNAVTGLAAALGERVPAVVIGGEVPRAKFGRHALQEGSADAIDVVSIVRTVTRSAECMILADRAGYQLAAAAERARSERGPVFLSLPLDVAIASTPEVRLARAPRTPTPLDEAAVEEAALALHRAERPLILVGSGARGASEGVRALAERLAIPVITSPKAKGIVPESAPYCLGVFGYGGHPSASEWLRAHPPDVVLALGCGFSEPSTNSWSPLLAPTRTMIQVDLDPACFGRNYRVDLAILADTADVVDRLDEKLQHRAPRITRLTGVRRLECAKSSDGGLSPAEVVTALSSQMPPDTVFTADIGEHLLYAIHHLKVERPDQFIACLTLGSMGSGIGAAIGAKLVAPERPVVAICGDYGFQMYGMELNTCVQQGIGVIFAIMNDARMRMVEAGVARNYGRAMYMDGPRVDFSQIAHAHGADGFIVRTHEELSSALAQARPDVPAVLDIRIDPDASFPVNPRAEEISNFTAK